MNNLVRIIGKAPSEMSDEALAAALTKERNRVREAIERFNATPVKAARKKKLSKIVAESGFSIDEIRLLIEEEKNARSKET